MNAIVKLAKAASQRIMKCKPIAKAMVKVGKNKPELLAITGGVAVVASVVLYIRSGMKLQGSLDEAVAKVEALEKKQAEELAVDELTEEQKANILKACGKEIRKARGEGVWKIARLFVLPTGVLVVGLTLIGKGHLILKQRNVVLAAAAEGYKKTLDFYRKNVVADQGKEADLKYMRGVVGSEDVETVEKDGNGKEKKTVKKVPVVKTTKNHENPWRFMFNDTYFASCSGDIERDLYFLKLAQDFWEYRFQNSGYGEEGISMYDILKYLDYKFEVDKDGMTKQQYKDWITFLRNYGWRKGNGDDCIDFGLYRAINEPAMTRRSDMAWIEFNCSGNLQDLSIN